MFYITVKYVRPEQFKQLTFEDVFNQNPAPVPLLKSELFIHRTVVRNTLDDNIRELYQNSARIFFHMFGATISSYNDQDMGAYYDHFRIPKRSGGTRPIDAPNAHLKAIMEEMLHWFNTQPIYPHANAFAYVVGKTHADAAQKHAKTGHKNYLKLDLHNFFGSCNHDFLIKYLKMDPFFAQFDEIKLGQFIHFCTLNNGLPQGTPLSPWLTNIIMRPFDHDITTFCRKHNVTYTRYADDMNFSFNGGRQMADQICKAVTDLLIHTPLELNLEKTKLTTLAGQTHILGLTISNDSKVTVNNKRKEICRATIWDILNNPEKWSGAEASQFLGQLNYFMQIENEYFSNLIQRYTEKTGKDVIEVLIDRIKNAR